MAIASPRIMFLPINILINKFKLTPLTRIVEGTFLKDTHSKMVEGRVRKPKHTFVLKFLFVIILKSKFFLDDPPSLLLVSAPDYLSWLLAEQSFNRLGFWRP